MKIMITFLSALIVFFGIIPFFAEDAILPTSGFLYPIYLIVLGIIIIGLGILNSLLIGFERLFVYLQGGLLIVVGLLFFVPTVLSWFPREGPMYAGAVLILGGIGLLYGLLGMS